MKQPYILFLLLICSSFTVKGSERVDDNYSIIALDYVKAGAAGVLSLVTLPAAYLAVKSVKADHDTEDINTHRATFFYTTISGLTRVASNKLVASMSEKRRAKGVYAKYLGLSFGGMSVAKMLEQEYSSTYK